MVSLRITPDYTSDRADVVGLLYGNDNATVTIANFADELRATSRVRIVLNDDTLLTVGSLTPENENDVRGNLIVRGVQLIEHISRKMREPTQVGVKVIIDDAEDESAPTYTGRTMLLLNWDEHDPSSPEPSVPGNYIPVTSIANLPDHYKDSDMKAKIDEICAIIRQSATALAFAFLLPFFSQAASVHVFTADKQDIYNDGKIVTNVTLDASGLATDEQVQANSEKIAAVSNDVRTVDAKVETHKVREDNPHNVTADQVGAYTKDETDSRIAGHVPPPPPNYDVVSNRAMTALQSYTETDPVFAAWLALGPFAPFATMEWVNGRGFATQNWVGDQGFLKSYTETDPTVPGWAKQADKPSYTATEVGALPNNRVQLIVNPNFQDAVRYVQIKPSQQSIDTNQVVDIIHDTVDGAARPLPKYLHLYDADDSYPDEAQEYYRSRGDGKVSGGCSAVRDGDFLYRNFDYPFDERAEFVVKMSAGPNRFASVGVAQVGTNLTEQFVVSGKPSRCYKWLPGATVDGVNEKGVVAEINVVDGDPQTSGWHNDTGDLHPLEAVRWALDNGTGAEMVASNLAARIAFPSGWTQNFHYMIADAEGTWIVENGAFVSTGTTYRYQPLTNCRVVKKVSIYPDIELFTYDPFRPSDGMGMERLRTLLDGASITNVWYTNAYRRETNPQWVSDLADVLAYTNDIYNAWASHPKEYFRNKTNGGEPWWQTVHTSAYDIPNLVLRIAVQERDDWYVFQVPSGGAVKSVNGETGDVELNARKVGAIAAGENPNGSFSLDPPSGFLGGTSIEFSNSHITKSVMFTPDVGDFEPDYWDWISYGTLGIGTWLDFWVSRKVEEVVTPVVNRVKDLHWDPGLEVTWTNIVHNGHIYYVTVTNTNVSVATP